MPKNNAEGLSDTLAMQESNTDVAVAANDPRARKVLVRKASSALGTPYVRGGTAPGGFDCSGLVQWTFNHVGVALPRTAREQSQVGNAVRNVDEMQAGDIVAFRHPRRGYHTGIYVGEGKFIHSPRKRTRVQVASLNDPYFSQTFLGARRVVVRSKSDVAVAEARALVAERYVDAPDDDSVSEIPVGVSLVAARTKRNLDDADAPKNRKKSSDKDKKKSGVEKGTKDKKSTPATRQRKPQKPPSDSADARSPQKNKASASTPTRKTKVSPPHSAAVAQRGA